MGPGVFKLNALAGRDQSGALGRMREICHSENDKEQEISKEVTAEKKLGDASEK